MLQAIQKLLKDYYDSSYDLTIFKSDGEVGSIDVNDDHGKYLAMKG